MLRKIIKNKRAQNTAEYAILISLVVAGIVAMQTYAQRALQARVRDASQFMTSVAINGDLTTAQYEPYYLESAYNVQTADSEQELLNVNSFTRVTDNTRTREEGGSQVSQYNAAGGYAPGDEVDW